MKLSRRKFLVFFIGTIVFTPIFFEKLDKKVEIFDTELRQKIIKFNSERISDLENNLENQIKFDLLNDRTIWADNLIYTYAELYERI